MNNSTNCSGKRKALTGPGLVLTKMSLLIIVPALVVSACGQAYEQHMAENEKSVADSVSAYVPGIHKDTIHGKSYNFIRKADLKCKVKNVVESTTVIEKMTNRCGGYVENSEIRSTKDFSRNIHFKKDSLLEQTYYTSDANITLRIPSDRIDSILGEITSMAVFVDHRQFGASDVKNKIFSNILAENRYREFKQRVNKQSDKSNSRIDKVTEAEEAALYKQQLADNKRIETYELAEQVNMSTITLQIYQDQQIMSRVTPAPQAIEPYTPSFLSKLGEGLLNGFELLKNLILFFANIWSVLLIIGLLLLFTRRMIVRYGK